MVGHTQHDYNQMIQIADLTGVYGVTFLVVLVNAAIWSVLERSVGVRRWLKSPGDVPVLSYRPGLIALCLLVATFVYGVVQTNGPKFLQGPRVAILQTNLTQDIKIERGKEMWTQPSGLADAAVHPAANEPMPDLLIWPETALPLGWYELGPGVKLTDVEPGFGRECNLAGEDMKELSRRWPVNILYGRPTFQWESDGREWRYNSALLVNARGEPLGRYDKIHLVPLGEYVPFPETFPFLKAFTPYDAEYSCKPGETWTRFPLQVGEKTYHFACLICYEDTDASMARKYVEPGEPGVDFIVNISNDGWFHGTEEHEQHLAICQFRAIETRRSVVRAVNMGISAIIDPDGRVVALPGETWAKSKNIEGGVVLRGTVPIDTRITLYARFGDWLPVTAWLVFLGAVVLGIVRRRRSPPVVRKLPTSEFLLRYPPSLGYPHSRVPSRRVFACSVLLSALVFAFVPRFGRMPASNSTRARCWPTISCRPQRSTRRFSTRRPTSRSNLK